MEGRGQCEGRTCQGGGGPEGSETVAEDDDGGGKMTGAAEYVK